MVGSSRSQHHLIPERRSEDIQQRYMYLHIWRCESRNATELSHPSPGSGLIPDRGPAPRRQRVRADTSGFPIAPVGSLPYRPPALLERRANSDPTRFGCWPFRDGGVWSASFPILIRTNISVVGNNHADSLQSLVREIIERRGQILTGDKFCTPVGRVRSKTPVRRG